MQFKFAGQIVRMLLTSALLMSGLAFGYGAVAPAAAAADASKLAWLPPTLSNPITINVGPTNQSLVLDNTKDYFLRLTAPLTASGGLVIAGGHNVVLIGGEIQVPTAAVEPDPVKRRGLYLKGQTGTLHIEGLHIGGADLSEGINLDERNGATVQLQNITVDTVQGTQATNHADVIQTWAGPNVLRIDRLRGQTSYQGMFLLPHQLWNGPTGTWDFRNIDISGTAESGYSLWKEDGVNIDSSNVFVHKSNGSTNKAFWPNANAWTGAVIGTPLSAAFVSGIPGMSYATPGYASGSWSAPGSTTTTTSTVPAPTTTTSTVPATTTTTTAVAQPATTTTSTTVAAVPARTSVATPAPQPAGKGYWMVASDGGIFAYGDAGFYGSTGGMKLNQPIVGMAGTPSNKGYWMTARDGGIFAFGDAAFYGSTGGMKLNQPIVGMAPTPGGKGYWLNATDGGIFAFGDAAFYGSTGGMKLNQPIVGMAPTPGGKGYWLVARDGGIFAFGDAAFYGSTGGTKLNQPIVGMAPTPNGKGYWLVARDGGIFAFGDAVFYGSGAGVAPGDVTSIQSTTSGKGYLIQSSTGWVGAFGDASHVGSVTTPLNQQVVSASAVR